MTKRKSAAKAKTSSKKSAPRNIPAASDEAPVEAAVAPPSQAGQWGDR